MKRALVVLVVLALLAVLLWRAWDHSTGRHAGPTPEMEKPVLEPKPASIHSVTSPQPHGEAQDSTKIFSRVISGYAQARLHPIGDSEDFRFLRELIYHVVELRLFALSYPEEAEKLALPLLLSVENPPLDRMAALEIVGRLAASGSAPCEKALLEIASRAGDKLRNGALSFLLEADTEGKHRSLYRQLAREGTFEAIAGLARWPDADSIPSLQEVADRGRESPYPAGTASYMAQQSIERIRMLQNSPDLAKDLGEILSTVRGKGMSWQEWAIQVAMRGPLVSSLLPVLKKRLEAADAKVLELRPTEPEDPRYSQIAGDPLYDDLLLAYSKGGGDLTESHRRRLLRFGYGGGSKARLAEILAGQK